LSLKSHRENEPEFPYVDIKLRLYKEWISIKKIGVGKISSLTVFGIPM
jgi:hypothetical protein